MAVTQQQKNQHLLWRLGFGPSAADLSQVEKESHSSLFKKMLQKAAKEVVPINVISGELGDMMENALEKRKNLDTEERKKLQKALRENIRNLNLAWMQEMIGSEAQLREKMAFFWHGHFACRNLNVFFQQELLQVIRKHALGNFRDLLMGVSKTAAMLNFLNNNQNRKGHPNENFAREVMELFTMGRGHYTETDIKEAARAFTGWGATPTGQFVFRKNQHDFEPKTVLGKTGDLNAEDVLNLLLEKKETAEYITRKLYRFLVSEEVNEARVTALATQFYTSNYDIKTLLNEIVKADWFYDPAIIGSHIKSPVELLVGLQRMLPMQLEKPESMLLMQRVLGQLLFYPPNVAGWPGGKTWIDSSTLMMRMRIPQLINDRDDFNVDPKDDDDQMMGIKSNQLQQGKAGKGQKPIAAHIEWAAYVQHFQQTPRAELLNSLQSCLLQTTSSVPASLLEAYTDKSSRESFIRTVTLQIMSTPEYQLC